MKYLCSGDTIAIEASSVIVLGNFDGVHRGHQKLLTTSLELAREKGLIAIALSFYPHPTSVLGKSKKPLVMSRADRKNKMEEIGMDIFIEYPFTKTFAGISPDTFFTHILMEKLKAKVIVVGSNYFFGKDKKGDSNYLKHLGKLYDIEVCVIDTVMENGEIISSTHIRQLILEGAMEKAQELLGYPYTIVGHVAHGKKLGRTIGFPTINLVAEADRVYPPNGVYATMVKVYNETYMGITNVGYNPTVGNTHKTIETHILGFDQQIYGEEVEVMFYSYLRPEQKFENINILSQQIAKDKEKAIKFLTDKMK